MRIPTGRLDVSVRYRPLQGTRFAPVQAIAVRAIPPGVAALRPHTGNPPSRWPELAAPLLDAYGLLDALRALGDAEGLAAFMEANGPLLPVLPQRELVWGVETLLGELRTILAVADVLLDGSLGTLPSAAGAPLHGSDDSLGDLVANGIERLARLEVTADATGGAPRLEVVADSLCGLAWLMLGAWADALRPGSADASDFTIARCTNDRCGRPFPKVGKIAYCEECRATGADLAYQRRRRYAAERGEGITSGSR